MLPWMLLVMIGILVLPLYQAWREEDLWQVMLALASVTTKSAVILLLVSVLRDDWMLGVAGVIILSVGNAGFMLLAHLLKRMANL
jgi:multicomponent Na+:H+ antiporter subunit F